MIESRHKYRQKDRQKAKMTDIQRPADRQLLGLTDRKTELDKQNDRDTDTQKDTETEKNQEKKRQKDRSIL